MMQEVLAAAILSFEDAADAVPLQCRLLCRLLLGFRTCLIRSALRPAPDQGAASLQESSAQNNLGLGATITAAPKTKSIRP